MTRRYFFDSETGRSHFTDGELPDDPLIEEITGIEFYKRETVAMGGRALRFFYDPVLEELCRSYDDQPGMDEITAEEHSDIRMRRLEDEALA